MFCPRCEIDTGEDSFCEKCGGETVASDEIVSTSEVKAKFPHIIKQNNMEKKIKSTTSKVSIKTTICYIAFAVILIGGFTGYKVLQLKYTPETAVNQYYTYLANKDYTNAYKMLINTDNNFMSESMFEKSVENQNFKNYSIKLFNKNAFDPTEKSSNATTYAVKASGLDYVAEVMQSGKKNLIFNNYKINAKNFTSSDWDFDVPHGAEIYVNGKKVNNLVTSATENSAVSGLNGQSSAYITKTDSYQINSIFTGNYTVKMKLLGDSDLTVNNVAVGTKVSTDFKIKKSLEQQLQSQATELLKAYYGKKDMSKFLSSDSDVESELKSSESLYAGDTGIQPRGTMHNDLTVEASSLDDSTHANINVKYTVNNPVISVDKVTVLGNPDNALTKIIYFEKTNGKWLICSADLYN